MKYLVLTPLALLFFLTASIALADASAGKAVYGKVCASCHGTSGLGDGPVGVSLPPNMKPANLVKGDFKVVKDANAIVELLTKGGPAFGLNPLMAAQPSLSDQEKKDVAEYVLSLKE